MDIQQLVNLIFPFVILIIFYLILIRPQQKRDKALKEMRSQLKIGEIVVTIGGLVGKIIKVMDDEITIENGNDKTKITFEKWAIARIKK